MLVALAQLGTPEMVGQFALGLAVTAPIMLFLDLNLRDVQATDARRDFLFGNYLALRLVTILLALLIILGVVLTVGYRLELALTICIIGLAKAFESLSDVYHGLLQQHERMDRVAQALLIKGPLSLVALVIGVMITGHIIGGAIGLALAWLTVLLTYDMHSTKLLDMTPTEAQIASNQALQATSGRPIWNLAVMYRLAWIALPLGVAMLMISLNANAPRYIIEGSLGEHELGIFAALSYLMVAGNIVISAVGTSASPRLAKYFVAGQRRDYLVLLGKLVALAVVLGSGAVLGALIVGEPVLRLIYTAEYARQELFVWLMIAAAFQYIGSFMGYGMTAARYFRIQTIIFGLVTATTALACMVLIPIHGLIGAAFALIIAAIVQIFASAMVIYYVTRSEQPIRQTV
jgi:O-antigen/teichoic acid export membrane protein